MSLRPRRTEGAPHERLTSLTDAALTAIEQDPQYKAGDRAMVMLNDADGGGIGLHGYDSEVDAIVDLMTHLKAMLELRGQSMEIHAIGDRNAN